MAADDVRSSARVAPRSVGREAAVSARIAGDVGGVGAHRAGHREVAHGAVAHALARTTSPSRWAAGTPRPRTASRRARTPRARGRSRSTAPRAPRPRCSARRRARSSWRSGTRARSRRAARRVLNRSQTSGRWLRGSHWPSSSRKESTRSLARARSSSRRAPPNAASKPCSAQRVEQRRRSAAGCATAPSSCARPASIESCTRGDDQLLAQLRHAPVAELEHLGEVVAGVDVQDRARERRRAGTPSRPGAAARSSPCRR